MRNFWNKSLILGSNEIMYEFQRIVYISVIISCFRAYETFSDDQKIRFTFNLNENNSFSMHLLIYFEQYNRRLHMQ